MLFKNITLVGKDYLVQENMFLQTEGDAIVYIGTKAPEDYKGDAYDGENKVAMPGFYNPHCHVPMTILRGYGEGLPLDRWLHDRVFPFEDLMVPDDMYWGSMLGMAELISSGAVSFTDMYMNLSAICRAVEDSGMKASLCHGSTSGIDSPLTFKEVAGYQGLQDIISYTKSVSHDRVIADIGIHAEYTSSDLMVRGAADYAKEHGLRVHLHLSESKTEHEGCKARRGGKTPTEYFQSLGVFDVPTTAAHCVWLEGNDFDILAKHGVTAVHCPSSNLKLGSGIAKMKQMLDAGMQVTIGTDGAASNNNLNVLEEVNLAAMVQKGINQDPLFLSTQDILTLSCKNGALAQGRENCGSIEVGNRADIVIYDMDRPHLQPVFDVLSNILYSAQASDVVLSMIDGKVVYKDGIFTTIDIEQAKFHVNRIAKEKLELLNK